jgi:hypothetical protein
MRVSIPDGNYWALQLEPKHGWVIKKSFNSRWELLGVATKKNRFWAMMEAFQFPMGIIGRCNLL